MKYIKRHFTLSLPVVLGQAGHMITSLADTVMVGRLGEVPLGAVTFAHSVFVIPFLFGVGLANGLTPLVGKANGERNRPEVRALFKNAFLTHAIMALTLSGLMFFISSYFHLFKQPEEVTSVSVPYFVILTFSIIPYQMFLLGKHTIEGLEKTRPAMFIIISCNLLNVALNYFLIFGKWGFPELGVNGAGIATLIARVLMMSLMFLYIWGRKEFNDLLIYFNSVKIKWNRIKKICKVGFPVAFQFVFEVCLFAFGTIMVGWYGSAPLAAHQIAINTASLTYMMSAGLAASSTIMISNHLGMKKIKPIHTIFYSASFMSIIFMVFSGACLALFRYFIPTLFIQDENVVLIASKFLLAAAVFQVFDGLQVNAIGALRGVHDVKIPTFFIIFSYWGVGLPACFFFTRCIDLGPMGIWMGFILGLFTAAFLLFLRFEYFFRYKLSKVR